MSFELEHRTAIPRDSRVHVPTLVLWGKNDVALKPELAQASANLCDEGHAKIFPASHWLQHEKVEEINALLVEFFSRDYIRAYTTSSQ